MNNDGVRQISDEEIQKELSREELQQTQVLNLQEVQKAIHFEKVTSKKPAVLIAIIGIICLLFGGSLQVATSLNLKPTKVQKRVTKQNIKTTELNCIKTSINNPNGTNTIYNIIYKFENDKLMGFTKEYSISAAIEKEEGKRVVEQAIKEYEELVNETEGYSVTITSTANTTFTIKVKVDYKKLDLTRLNEIQQTKPYTKVDYNKNTLYETIKSEAIEKGFVVE
ncbi:MAG: hypothetical protein IK137_01915 [Bacilli bacterium]|nr:hypothetical protein [Bacilli bacterium]